MNKAKKVFLVIVRNIIKRIDGFSARKYMNAYIWYLKKIGVNLTGIPRFIHPSVMFDGMGYDKTYIGNNVVMSINVLILNHDYSITCGLRSIGKEIGESEAFWLKEVVIEDNVFVGANVTILPGTYIGENSIIGAGSVVKGRIPSESIVVGNPAKIVGNTVEWGNKKLLTNDYYWE